MITLTRHKLAPGAQVGSNDNKLSVVSQVSGDDEPAPWHTYVAVDADKKEFVYRSVARQNSDVMWHFLDATDPQRNTFEVAEQVAEGEDWLGLRRKVYDTVRSRTEGGARPVPWIEFNDVFTKTLGALKLLEGKHLHTVDLTLDSILISSVGQRDAYVVDAFGFSPGVLAPSTELGVLLLELHGALAPRRPGQAPDAWSIVYGLERLLRRAAARFWWAYHGPVQNAESRQERIREAEFLLRIFGMAWASLVDRSGLERVSKATVVDEQVAWYDGALEEYSHFDAGRILAHEDYKGLRRWSAQSSGFEPLDIFAYLTRATKRLALDVRGEAIYRRFFSDYEHRWNSPSPGGGSWGLLLGALAAVAPRELLRFLRIHRRAQRFGFEPAMVPRLFQCWGGLIGRACEAAGGDRVRSQAWRGFETAPTSQPVRAVGYALGSVVVALQRVFAELGQSRNLRSPSAPAILGSPAVDFSLGAMTESRLSSMARLYLKDGQTTPRSQAEIVKDAFQISDERLNSITGEQPNRLAALLKLATELDFYVLENYVPHLLDLAIVLPGGGAPTTLAKLVSAERGAEALEIVRGWLTYDMIPG